LGRSATKKNALRANPCVNLVEYRKVCSECNEGDVRQSDKLHYYFLRSTDALLHTNALLYCICVSECGHMNHVCQDNEGMQAGEPIYNSEEKPEISLFVAAF
jgi:hypothetical protein